MLPIDQRHNGVPSGVTSLSPIRFRNVADHAGLHFVLENHPTPQKHLIEGMAGGVAAFDYNNDGLTDVFFTNGASIPSLQKDSPKYFNRLFRNEGGMRFTDVTEDAGVAGTGYSMGAAAGDYDNDGHVDLFVAGVFRNTLYHNRGDGHFEDVTEKAGIKSDKWAVAAGWFDYNNDGLLDLFVVITLPGHRATIVSAATPRATCEFIATRRTSRASATRFTATVEMRRLKMSPSEPGSPRSSAGA